MIVKMDRVVIIAATSDELTYLKSELGIPPHQHTHEIEGTIFKLVVSGVGAVNAAICTTQEILSFRPDLLLQVGIAGSYKRDLPLGSVWEVSQEREADLGIEQADGSVLSLSEVGLETSDREMENPYDLNLGLSRCKGLTVQTVTGTDARLDYLVNRFAADVESMEGAGFFGSCMRHETPFAQIRSISNYVEPRNRANWKMKMALENLGLTVAEIVRRITLR